MYYMNTDNEIISGVDIGMISCCSGLPWSKLLQVLCDRNEMSFLGDSHKFTGAVSDLRRDSHGSDQVGDWETLGAKTARISVTNIFS